MPVTRSKAGACPASLQPHSSPAPKAPFSPPPEIAEKLRARQVGERLEAARAALALDGGNELRLEALADTLGREEPLVGDAEHRRLPGMAARYGGPAFRQSTTRQAGQRGAGCEAEDASTRRASGFCKMN